MGIDFTEELHRAAEKSLLHIIQEGNWVQPDYNNRFKVPPEFVQEIWKLVDKEKLQQAMARRLEEELADRIVNHLASEIATDIKQILSVKERREALRNIAREHIDSIVRLGDGS